MMFQFILMMLIVLCTLYWAWQGAFSSVLMLIAAVFAAALAMGVHEVFIPNFSKFRPDYARPVLFFLTFAFTCSLLRLIGGIAAPRRIRLPAWLDVSLSGGLGFLIALVMFGTLTIGIEMLPGYQKILGYDRYPNGLAKEPVQTWLRADDFVQWLWSQTNGGSLGGQSLVVDHPDLERELYGARHVVTFGSNPVVPADLLEVPAVYVLKTTGVIDKALHHAIAVPADMKVVIIRSQISKGMEWPDISCDYKDNLYRVTPAQVRLVTSPPAQYNPIGYMENGNFFKPLNLDTGHLVWGYSGGKATIVSDWVFVIPADADPRFFEEKQTARRNIVDLASVASAAPDVFVAAGSNDYPSDTMIGPMIQIQLRHSYGNVTDQPVPSQDVYLLRRTVIKRRVQKEMREAYSILENNTILGAGQKISYETQFRNMAVASAPDDEVPVSDFLRLLFVAHETSDPAEDVRTMEFFIEHTILPLILDPDKNLVAWVGTTGSDGKSPTKRVAPGGYTVFAWSLPKEAGLFHLWVYDVAVNPVTAAPGSIDSLQILRLDDTNIRYARP